MADDTKPKPQHKHPPLNRRERALLHAMFHEEQCRREWMRKHAASAAPRELPPRTHGNFPEAPRNGPWWGVQRLGPHGRFAYRAMFRHATHEEATLEAQFLAQHYPGGVFAVMQMVDLYYIDTPELTGIKVNLVATQEIDPRDQEGIDNGEHKLSTWIGD